MRPALRFVLLLAAATVARAAEPILKVVTLEKTLTFTAAEFAALPRTELQVMDPHSKSARRFAGVAVEEILARAGAPLGEKLRGPALALAVVARAKDGYAVVFSLPDFDEAFSTRTLILADTDDGKPLAENSAPLRLIAPGDQKGARWARMVTSLEIISVGAAEHAGHGKTP